MTFVSAAAGTKQKRVGSSEKIIKHTMHLEDGDKRIYCQVLVIVSNAVPRIIGQSGININAIREATDANIEVEKMSKLKTDQPRYFKPYDKTGNIEET
jgi:transcription antitermination factor NusA-like protein